MSFTFFPDTQRLASALFPRMYYNPPPGYTAGDQGARLRPLHFACKNSTPRSFFSWELK